MIQGTTKTESNYRAIYLDSSSSLKDFSLDRKKYFRKYILNEVVEEKENQAINMGKLVETLLLEPHLFDNKFYMSACASTPTGLMLAFVEALYKATRDATNENGTLTMNFEELSKLAYVESGFKIKYEAVLAKFIDSDNQIYYDELIKVKTNGLTVVTLDEVTTAERIVEELKTNFVTKDILTKIDSQRWTVLDQYQVENYTVDGHPFKSMMDRVVIDHEHQTIQVYDLKCVWAVENFYEEYYLYRRAYIQGFLYYQACLHMANDSMNEFFGYKVLPPQFIVCDSTNYFNPLIYIMTDDDLNDAYLGFEHKGRKYPGVKDLIASLNWAMDNNVWNISRDNYLNNGIVTLK